jgi:hypothetical protein
LVCLLVAQIVDHRVQLLLGGIAIQQLDQAVHFFVQMHASRGAIAQNGPTQRSDTTWVLSTASPPCARSSITRTTTWSGALATLDQSR